MRSRAWLVAAAALLVLAAWLMARGDTVKAEKKPRVAFRRWPDAQESQRNARRRTLPPPQNVRPDTWVQKRDPMLVALPTARGKSTVVFEAAALRTSPLGKLWLDCVLDEHGKKELGELKSKVGIDPLLDVDRVAVSSSKMMVLSGELGDAHLEALAGRRSYGVDGAVFTRPDQDVAFGSWKGEMIFVAKDQAAIEEAIDRLEGRSDPQDPPIPEQSAYGDAYGVISPDELADVLGDDQKEIAERLRGAADRIELHVNAASDVGIVARVSGPDESEVSDLGKTLGAAMSVGRLTARSQGDEKLAELLDLAKVQPSSSTFDLELGLPLPMIERELGKCRKKRGDAGR